MMRYFAVLMLLAGAALGQVASLMPEPRLQFFDNSGRPLAGGRLYTYAAGTTTPLATYTTSAGNVALPNPVVLDAAGRATVWLGAASYKIELRTSADVVLWTVDNVYDWGQILKADLASTASGKGAALIGYQSPAPGALASTVKAKLDQTVSVADYGAVCDGVTDTTSAIQAALTAAAGKVLTFNSGNTCVVGQLIVPSGTTLLGPGKLKLKALANTDLLRNASFPNPGDTNIAIIGMDLDANAGNQSVIFSSAIHFSGVTGVRVEGSYIHDAQAHGVWLDDACFDFRVTGNRIKGLTVGSGILIGNTPPESASSRGVIANNTVSDAAAANGIFILGAKSLSTYGCDQIAITGNTITNATDVAIEIGAGCQNITATGNTVFMDSTDYTGIMVRSARNVVIAGNTVRGTTSAVGPQDGYFFWGWSGGPDTTILENLTVTGNLAMNCQRYGFSMNSGTRIHLAGNISYGNVAENYFVNPSGSPILINFTRDANDFDPQLSIVPTTTNVSDLGDPTHYWRFAYLSNILASTINFGSNPALFGQINLSNGNSINFKDALGTGDRTMFSSSGNSIVVGSPMTFDNGVTTNSIEKVDGVNIVGSLSIGGSAAPTSVVTCGAGQALKSVDIRKGVVFAWTCAAP
jgi:hypothetical protein